jgi:methylated-DNA-[protein]-cysteine S-methyltransferase
MKTLAPPADLAAPLFAAAIDTPVGPFSFAVSADGALVATAFGNTSALAAYFSPETRFIIDARATRPTAAARVQFEAYFADARAEFALPLAPVGSEFRRRVWTALCAIPRGETQSYGALARALGSSARAVGRANATNPLCVVIPCHRVIGADGKLTGFAFGIAIKEWLLKHEEALAGLLF